MPQNSSSTLWISVKYGIIRKLFSRGIQCCRHCRMRVIPYGKHWQLTKLCHFHQINNIGDNQIQNSPIWTFPLTSRTYSLPYGECQQLPKLCHFHQINNIGDYQIWTPPIWTFPLTPRTFSFHSASLEVIFSMNSRQKYGFG